jgi:hypothetical protein
MAPVAELFHTPPPLQKELTITEFAVLARSVDRRIAAAEARARR